MFSFLQRILRRQPQVESLPKSFTPPKQPDPQPVRPPKPAKPSKDFYLSPDEAKTYGDINYMRTSKVVKRTFLGGAFESVEAVSALEKKTLVDEAKAETEARPTTASPAEPQRRRPSSDLDKFRQMAKDINRKP